jgi:hypothetical protein
MKRIIQCDVCDRHLTRSAVVRLIALVGVLAFVFSAVCPDDDELQQECGQSSKHAQCLVQSRKTVPRIHGPIVRPARLAIVPQSWSSFCCSAVARTAISDMKIGIRVFHSPVGDRSPPTKQVES